MVSMIVIEYSHGGENYSKHKKKQSLNPPPPKKMLSFCQKVTKNVSKSLLEHLSLIGVSSEALEMVAKIF